MLLLKKVQASSLVSTIILSLVVLITGSMLLLTVYHYKYFQTKDSIDQRLQDNLQSAIAFVLQDTVLTTQAFADSFALFDSKPDSIAYTQQPWGCFPLASIKVSYKNRVKTKSFLYGASQQFYSNASLYVADHDRPLSLSGDTYIQGSAYLPKSGLRSGFFGQQGFSRKKLIEGEILSSGKTLPPLNPAFKEYFLQLSRYVNDTLTKFEQLTTDSITHSFDLPALLVKLPKNGFLFNRTLKGKIILVSDSVITVEPTTKLTDAILIAPFIHFKTGFKGAVQAFALDSITVEPDCNFRYPSSLVGLGRNEMLGNTGSTLTIHSNSTVEGIVMAVGGEGKSNIKPTVKIKKGATVNGLVYNDGYSYLNGKVAGAIFTHFFFEQRGPLSMENILIDATIVQSHWLKEADYYSIFTGASRQKVMKWLY